MEFEIETELLPAPMGRPLNWRKIVVTLACTAVTCIFLIMVYVKLESVNIEENRAGCQTGLRGSDGHKGQEGAPWAEGHPGEPQMPDPTELKGNTESGPASLLGVETLTAGIQNLTSSNRIVEGIIVGTTHGVVTISLDSLEQRRISSSSTIVFGVAFNWQSRKVYWIEFLVGIKIANLDGSSEELLTGARGDNSLGGLAVDQITGNLYYGSKEGIRVCDSMGKKCVTVVSAYNNVGGSIWDIALYPSEGLMFWSSPSPLGSKSIARADMDGTNATVIISENVHGLCLDEVTEKLYWTSYYGTSIGHCDLNGNNRNVLLKTTIHPNDIAVDGDRVYFSGRGPNGVYSVSSTGQVSFIANATAPVVHITLYGRNKAFSVSNHCSNSPYPNLCVLTRVSYACL